MRQAILGSMMLLMLALASPATAATFQWTQVDGKWRLAHPVYANQYTGEGNTVVAENYALQTDEELRALVTESGIPPGSNNSNAQAKDAAYYLARLYSETGNTLYAHKAAVLLHRFAEVFPQWPFYDTGGNPYPQSGTPVYYGSMWGSTWYYYDLNQPALPIALAWDIIQDTGEVEALGSGARQLIETDLIERNVKIYTERYPRGFGNVDADLLHGIMIWGLCMNDPAVIHKGARWASEHFRVSWYPSGAFHEGLGSYHLMIGCRLEWAILNNPLKGYSDPPAWTYPQDGTRYDNLNMEAELLTPRTNSANVMRNTLMPNGRFVAVHDANWTDNNTRSSLPASVKNYVPTEQHPYILPDFGHAIMAGGGGTAQSQVHLHFSGTHSHEHLDNLNLILYAKGKELFSETAYESTADSTREWHTATAAHNTVVIDQTSQNAKGSANFRTIVPELDGIPEVPDYPLTADKLGGDHHLAMNKGNLQLWEANHEPVQITEVAAEKAYYPASPAIYRRTLARIVGNGSDFYVVDIFRVAGGTIHDWMLHGNLEEAYTIETPLTMNSASGTIHSYIALTKSLTTANPLEFRFVSPGGETVRTLMAPAAGTEVLIGQGPAMRRSGTAQFLDIRRTGSEDVFAAVHEPYISQARVSQLTQLTPAAGSSTNAVALKIALADRTDYFLSTMGPTEKAIVTDGSLNLSLEGHVGYVTVQDGKITKLYLVDGAKLEAGSDTITAAGYDGAVTASYSKTNLLRVADAMNAFEVDGTLPVGTALKGRTILLTDGEGRTHGFEIDSVTHSAGKTLVMLASDPGVKIADGVFKMLYFPTWGVPRTVTYHIAGTALQETPAPVTVWLPDGGPAQIHAGDDLTVAWNLDLPTAGSTILLRLYNGTMLIADLGSFTNATGTGQTEFALPSWLMPAGNYFIRGISASNQTLWADTPLINVAGTSETTPHDNRLVERNPTTIYASNSYLDVGHLASYDKKYRDLIWFDLGGYSRPVKQAILSLYWYYPSSATRTNNTLVDIYRPAYGWDATYVSWTSKANGVDWTHAGGDWYDKNGTAQGSTPFASVAFNAWQLATYQYYSFDVTSLVNQYIQSGQNAGFFIKARTESENYISFNGLNSPNSATRPTLVVTIGISPVPAEVWTCYK